MSSSNKDWYSITNTYLDCRLNSIFFRVKEKFGGLSNMSNDFPICVNGYSIANNEALYQACRFPDYPEIQREIIIQHSGIAAKMKSKKYRKEFTRVDWDDVRVDIMRFCLQLKLQQYEKPFGLLLMSTTQTDIVERSSKDAFWGAVWDDNAGAYVGQNILGKLLMELRDWFFNCDMSLNERGLFSYNYIELLNVNNFLLLGNNIIL